MPKLIHFFSLWVIIVLMFSCRQQNDSEIMRSLDESFKTANTVITHVTNMQLNDLEGKTMDPPTMERAGIFFPKAKLIAEFTTILYDYIEEKKSRAAFTNKDFADLVKYLKEYKQDVLNRDSSVRQGFERNFYFINNFISSICRDTFFAASSLKKNISKEMYRVLLTSLQNEIKKIGYKTITYYNKKIGAFIESFDSFSAIVGQNSSILQPEEFLEINAGVGAFRKTAQPNININGKLLAINEVGYSTYKMKVPRQPGKYSVPVMIKFINQTTGKEELRSIEVEYTVTKPCN